MRSDAPRNAPRSLGSYDLLEKIADGGMGSVYRGRSRITDQVVAIKVLALPAGSSRDILLGRFRQEFRVASALEHPHIVRALDFGLEDEVPYLVMEFVDGPTLTDLIDRRGRLTEEEAIRLITEVAQGLDCAHGRGSVHRDVKPDNILLTAAGVAKLADLGLVKEVEAHHGLTRTGTGLGTPHFMAPEQFRDAKQADRRSDVYALAATLYTALTRALPFSGSSPVDTWRQKVHDAPPSPRRLVPDLSERVDWAVRRALSVDPSRRPASCREFVEDLTGRGVRRVTAGVFAEEEPRGVWFLMYRNREGVSRRCKGNTDAVRRLLREGQLGDASKARIGLSEDGPFEPLATYPEFRDLLVDPGAPVPRSGRGSWAETAPVEALARTPDPRQARTSPVPAGETSEPHPVTQQGQESGSPAWTLLAAVALAVVGFAVGLAMLPH